MTRRRVVKQLVCSECGQPLRERPVSTSSVDREAFSGDEEMEEHIAEADSEGYVEIVVEEGPVCPRCAKYR